MDIRDTIRRTASVMENDSVKNFRAQGGKVFATECIFAPAEIVHAAGALSIRLRGTGSRATDRAEVHYAPTHCSFVRHTFNQALTDQFAFCDGIIFATTCDHARRMYDVWKYTDCPPKERYLLTVPHVGNPEAVKAFADNLRLFATYISEQTGKQITDDSLRASIKTFNNQRRMIAKLYEMRKADKPPVNGKTMLAVWQMLSSVPVEEGNRMLDELIETVKGNPDEIPSDPIRLFLATTHIEDPERMAALESGKALIVNDMSCIGNAYFAGEVNEEGDPYMALSERILLRPSCPNIVDNFRDRLNYSQKLASEWNCDGMVYDHLQFCPFGDVEAYMYKQETLKSGLPYVSLQHELYGGGAGQVKTRIEAFTEQIDNIKRKKS